MKKIISSFAVALSLIISQQVFALTYEGFELKGNSCFSTTPGITAYYDIWGVRAPGATAINVSCPLVLKSRAYTYAWLMVEGYGRNSVDKVSCTIQATGGDGYNWLNGTALLAYNQVPYQVQTATITPAGINSMFSLSCHLPGSTASGTSHVTSLWVTVGY